MNAGAWKPVVQRSHLVHPERLSNRLTPSRRGVQLSKASERFQAELRRDTAVGLFDLHNHPAGHAAFHFTFDLFVLGFAQEGDT